MTYEEARKFLMNKKVFVKNKSEEIQEKLFEIGFGWDDGSTKRASYLTKPFLFMYKDMTLAYDDDVDYFYEHNYEEISAEDILNIKVERLPKTWKEFCENNPIKEETTKAYLALMQLHQLRDYYRKGSKFPYAISRNGSHLYISNNEDKFLSFQTKEIADEFLSNFSDLILQARDLI